MTIGDSEIRDELMRQLEARGADKSICPSEVARVLAPEWQSLMSRIRTVAIGLSREGRIDILRKGKPVDPHGVKGVIRLRLRPKPD
jgi:uncharacterized protein DUF3253